MKRIPLTDQSGKWFDLDTAEEFMEGTHWDGRNHISLATGDQYNHQVLYHTKGKRWILHLWSQWEGSSESYKEIDDEAAAKWLVTNGHEHADLAPIIEKLEVK